VGLGATSGPGPPLVSLFLGGRRSGSSEGERVGEVQVEGRGSEAEGPEVSFASTEEKRKEERLGQIGVFILETTSAAWRKSSIKIQRVTTGCSWRRGCGVAKATIEFF